MKGRGVAWVDDEQNPIFKKSNWDGDNQMLFRGGPDLGIGLEEYADLLEKEKRHVGACMFVFVFMHTYK